MQEATELVDFTAHDDIWSRVVLEVGFVMQYGLLELITLPGEFFNLVAKLENGKEIP